ncbi:MAG: carboxymuconolactone decarboxylase family protein [Rhodospirillales bacterium]|nr:MAG: carboxymuconolactone decarboxylase family protein [Rhodospirillales bacterium]
MAFKTHSIDTAPKGAEDTLAAVKDKFGFVPNVLGVMAEAPALAKAYVSLSTLFEETALSPTERNIVILAISTTNKCEYCVAAHSVGATMQKVPSDVIEALRRGKPLADSKLEALRRLASEIVENRGWPSQDVVQGFLDAGYTQKNLLEVIVGVGLKTLSNYTNHIAETPLDDAFQPAKWSEPADA